MDVRPDQSDVHAPLFRKRRCLELSRLGKIKANDAQPLLGQPDAVAPLAVGNRECPARRRQKPSAGLQEIIWILAKNEFRNTVTALPSLLFAHAATGPFRDRHPDMPAA